MTKFDGGTPISKKKNDAPNSQNSSLTYETNWEHHFSLVNFFSLQKSLSHYRYFNLSHSMFVSVQKYDIFSL